MKAGKEDKVSSGDRFGISCLGVERSFSKNCQQIVFIICFLGFERSLSASCRSGGAGIRASPTVPQRFFPDFRRGFRTPVRAAFRPASDLCRDLGSRPPSPFGARMRPDAPRFRAAFSVWEGTPIDCHPPTNPSQSLCLHTSGVCRPLSVLP